MPQVFDVMVIHVRCTAPAYGRSWNRTRDSILRCIDSCLGESVFCDLPRAPGEAKSLGHSFDFLRGGTKMNQIMVYAILGVMSLYAVLASVFVYVL